MNFNHLCVFDYETGGRNPETCEITKIGAQILDRNLRVIDEFNANLKPENLDAVEDDALRITRLTREQLETFPETAIVWQAFVDFVNKHNKKNSVYTAPIPAGYNIINYDMVLTRRYCKKYKTSWDDSRNDQKLFSQVYKFDILDHMWFWFENNSEIENLKLTTILEYMGARQEDIAEAHDALQDVKNTTNIILRLLKMQRAMTEVREDGTRRLEMKGCMLR